jgi:D-alanyl-D-alanine carboxypeptidase (penicillin-binding protein 5/6)
MRNGAFVKINRIGIAAVIIALTAAPICSFGEPSPGSNAAGAAPPVVSAKNAIVIEQITGKILYEKSSRQKAYPASITKIVTALLAIESGQMDKKVVVSGSAAGAEGSSIYLYAGEKLSMRDLVYGLMLRSGNDAALAISYALAPSVEEFVSKMNERAEQIGAMDTNFINPNGLFDENHYTTAYDMAIIAREAMKNPQFKEIVGAKSWTAQRGEGKYNYFYNKNKVIFDYPGGTGVKIGYTIKSGRTLVASSERNGMEVICVVMGAPDWFSDSYKLMDYAFEMFEMNAVFQGGGKLKAIPVKGGNKDHVFVGLKDVILLPAFKGENLKLEVIYRLRQVAYPPLRRWQEAGTIEIYNEGQLISTHPLYYLEDIDSVVTPKGK